MPKANSSASSVDQNRFVRKGFKNNKKIIIILIYIILNPGLDSQLALVRGQLMFLIRQIDSLTEQLSGTIEF